jgi:hypothetical protein
VPLVERIVRQHGIRLVIVDVLMAYLDGGVNAHRDQDVRRALAPLSRLADTTGATVLVLRHLNKATGGPALYRGGGSIGIVGAARVGLVTVLDPEDDTETRRILAVAKNNLAAIPPARTFTLTPDPDRDVARVKWLGTDGRHVDELLAHRADPEERTERDEAVEWIVDYLTMAGGRASSADAKRDGRRAGHSDRTLKRALKRAGVSVVREGFPSVTYWLLGTPDGPVGPQSGQLGQGSGLGPTGPTGGIGGPTGPSPTPNGDLPPGSCDVCGEALHRLLVDAGEHTHPRCHPEPEPTG